MAVDWNSEASGPREAWDFSYAHRLGRNSASAISDRMRGLVGGAPRFRGVIGGICDLKPAIFPPVAAPRTAAHRNTPMSVSRETFEANVQYSGALDHSYVDQKTRDANRARMTRDAIIKDIASTKVAISAAQTINDKNALYALQGKLSGLIVCRRLLKRPERCSNPPPERDV